MTENPIESSYISPTKEYINKDYSFYSLKALGNRLIELSLLIQKTNILIPRLKVI